VALSVVVVVVLVVPVSVAGIPNSSCAKAKEGYCCPSIALDVIPPVAAIEKTAIARSNPFVKICCIGRDFIINQGKSSLHIMTYTRYFGTKYFIFVLQDVHPFRPPLALGILLDIIKNYTSSRLKSIFCCYHSKQRRLQGPLDRRNRCI
jgi:hypothetical protein